MKTIDFAIERGFRLFKDEIQYFHFSMIQIKIDKILVPDGDYFFHLLDDQQQQIYSKNIKIDSINHRIITPNSHEDPLVEDNNEYMICFQLWDEDLKGLQPQHDHSSSFGLLFENEQKIHLIYEENIGNIYQIFTPPKNQLSHVENMYSLYSDKDCIFRCHLGDEEGNYEEKEHYLKANERFDFKSYLNYPYLGLQCSYENESPELEEKHIIIGQKGMTLSGNYIDENKEEYEALLPFDKKYQTVYSPLKLENQNEYGRYQQEKWSKVNTIEELLSFYENKTIHFFETTLEFIKEQYGNKKTYGLNKLITSQYEGRNHLSLTCCEECVHNSKCIQIVPSTISPLVFKKNLDLFEVEDCKIYQLIEKKLS